ncbi:helix-turn-helix domain-containing protein [Xanthobacter autotrophicus]|uniref:helix-turn-helix domain-containing protein n=1 Tax=Xanthobacter autotrophicus TaxID=280 RepID=UPI0037270C1A
MHEKATHPDDLLDISDAAARLAVSAYTVRQWRRYGVLKPATIGRRHAVTERSVAALARELGPPPPKPARPGRCRPHLRLVVDNS